MADITTMSVYPEGQVHDSAQGPLVPFAVGKVRLSPTGPEIPIYDNLGTALDGLHSNSYGVTPQFCADTGGASVYCDFGSYVSQLRPLGMDAADVQQAVSRAASAEQQAIAAAQSAQEAMQTAKAAIGTMTLDEAAQAAAAKLTDPVTGKIRADLLPAGGAGGVDATMALSKMQSNWMGV